MSELNDRRIDKQVKTIRRLVPELFSYLDEAARRNDYKTREREELELLEDELGDGFLEVMERVYLKLDNIVQSSAMVEKINSILRMHLYTTKNHVTQGMLNLFMHYHNYRRYVAGKRKGKTPMEILTGKPQHKDWLELLMEKVPWDQCAQLKPAA